LLLTVVNKILATHPWATLAVEAVTTLFFFAGFIAMSVFLSKLLFCRGSVCSAARADAVFAAFAWLSWSATTVLVALETFRGGFRGGAPSAKQNMTEA
jgi:hypothetical protein